MKRFLGLDTSNYTTSAALYFEGGEVIQEKKLLPVKEGQLGLRQSDAVFHHVAQLPEVFSALTAEAGETPPDAIGVSSRPRSVEGSYMPCFTVGLSAARILAAQLGAPLYSFSHQEGHIAAALYSAGQLALMERRFLAFHVSGGTTEAVLVHPEGEGMRCELVARTLDLNAGQAVDRVGGMLGLPFPAGPALEALAATCDGKFPKARPVLKGADCCLSGLQNQCERMIREGRPPAETAAYCLNMIEATLGAMCERLLAAHGSLPVLFAGGVTSNRLIRRGLTARFGAFFAEPAFSADNAAGVALLAARKAGCL